MINTLIQQTFEQYSSTGVINTIGEGWVVNSRGSILFKVGASNTLYTSIDNGSTYPYSISFAGANNIDTAHIMKNGNILFSTTDNKIYLTPYDLRWISEKIVTDAGAPMNIHTPSNSLYPGRYFYALNYPQQSNETNVYVWGNYGNVENGANPTNIYYTSDYGQTVKVAYAFGENTRFLDNGTSSGGTTGTLLGDSGNSIVTRHVHSVDYNPYTGKWIMITGDLESGHPLSFNNDEIHWFEGAYNTLTDAWTWVRLFTGIELTSDTHFKASQLFFTESYTYYISDVTNGTSINQSGIWKTLHADIGDISKHTKAFDYPLVTDVASSIKYDAGSHLVLYSLGGGRKDTLVILDINTGDYEEKTYTDMGFTRISDKQTNGYYRIDTERFATYPTLNNYFALKIGVDLFKNIQ